MRKIASLVSGLILFTMLSAQNSVHLKYPETAKTDQQDDYFGTIVKLLITR